MTDHTDPQRAMVRLHGPHHRQDPRRVRRPCPRPTSPPAPDVRCPVRRGFDGAGTSRTAAVVAAFPPSRPRSPRYGGGVVRGAMFAVHRCCVH
jgi:hypothetical protein